LYTQQSIGQMLQRRGTIPTCADRRDAVPHRRGRDEAPEIVDHRARTRPVGGHEFGLSAASHITQEVERNNCEPDMRCFRRVTQQQGLLEWPLLRSARVVELEAARREAGMLGIDAV